MTRTRRSLLAALLAGATGCLGSTSNVRYPETEATATSRGGGSGGGDSVATPEATTPTFQPAAAVESEATTQAAADRTVPNPRLAAATRRIDREIRWFAGQYEPALNNYRRRVRAAAGVVESVEAEMAREDGTYGPLTDDRLARIRGDIAEALEVTERWLGDQFVTDDHLRDETDYHLSTTERFKRRGDHDRVAEQLRNLAHFLYGVTREAYVQSVMPRHPIQNRLIGWLRGGPDRYTAFTVRYPAGGFATRVYSGKQVAVIGRPIVGDRRTTFESEFSGARSDDAVDAIYLVSYLPDYETPTARPRRRGDPVQEVPIRWDGLARQPILLQRFSDLRSATSAWETLVSPSGSLTVDGRYPFGGVDWRRVYWQYAGDVTYAYMTQAGEYLIAFAPSRTAWEERVDWAGPLESTFLGPGPEADSDSTGDGGS